MTITEYAVALGGMLAQLAGMGLLAAGLIKAKARKTYSREGGVATRAQ